MTADDKIQAYLDSEMTVAQELSFKKELENDPSLKKQYESYLIVKDISKGLVEVDMRETLEKETTRSSSVPRWMWIATLLIALSLVFYFIMLNDKSEETLYAEMYTEPIWPIKRGASDSLSAALAEWKESGSIEVATAKIKMIQSLDNTTKNYWIAEMFMNAQEMDSVRFYLPELPEDHMEFTRVQKIKNLLSLYN